MRSSYYMHRSVFRGNSAASRISNTSVVDLLFYAFLFIVVLLSTLGLTAGSRLYVGSVALGALFAVTRIVTQRYDRRSLMAVILLTALGVVELLVSKRVTLLLTALLLIGARGLEVRGVLGTFLAAKIVGLLLMAALVATGVFGVEQYSYFKMGSGEYITRVHINGSGTTTLHLSFLAIWFLYFYLRRGKAGAGAYLVFAVGNLFMYRLTGSYLGFALGYGSVAIFLLAQVWGGFRRLLVRISTWILPMLLLFSFGTAVLYGNSFVADLDRLFQGRIYYNRYFLGNYPFSFFGRGMLSDEGNFDNSYVFVWVCYGAVTFVALFGAMQKRMSQLKADGDWVAICLVAVYLVAAVSESFYPAAAVNPSLFLLTPLLDSKTPIKINRECSVAPRGRGASE